MTQRAKTKRQRSPARAPRRPPKLCEKCGAKPDDEHDIDAHYRAMLRRWGVLVEDETRSQ